MYSIGHRFGALFHAFALSILSLSAACGAVGDSQVANWKDNRTAAFLLMFDDSCHSHFQVAIPELVKRSMIATFYVNPGHNNWTTAANQWEEIIPKSGMVYGDHTWTHRGAKDLATQDSEIRLCQEKILGIFFKDNKPHLISYGQPGVSDWFSYGAEHKAILDKYNLISRPPFDAKHGTVFGLKTIDEMLALADKAIAEKGMEYIIIHGVERRPAEGDPKWGHQDFWALDKDVYRGLLDGLAAKRDKGDLWITDHISQHKYQQERDNKPAFQVQRATDQLIQLKMTGTLDRGLYDLPLTVITQVPATWHGATVLQGTQKAVVPVVNGAIQYDASPDGTVISLTPAARPMAPAKSKAL